MADSKKRINRDGDSVHIGFEEGAVTITVADARRLAKLKEHEGWPVLKQLLQGISDGCTYALRDRTKGIEDLRYAQGQSQVAGILADLIEEEIPAWYTEQVEQPSKDTTDERA